MHRQRLVIAGGMPLSAGGRARTTPPDASYAFTRSVTSATCAEASCQTVKSSRIWRAARAAILLPTPVASLPQPSPSSAIPIAPDTLLHPSLLLHFPPLHSPHT